MMRGLPLVLALSTTLAFAAPAFSTARADTAMPALYAKCANLNKKYLHGVGRLGARDIVRGATEPVTTFRRSTRIYRLAMSYNKRLDGDKDGIACEKA